MISEVRKNLKVSRDVEIVKSLRVVDKELIGVKYE